MLFVVCIFVKRLCKFCVLYIFFYQRMFILQFQFFIYLELGNYCESLVVVLDSSTYI